MNVYYQIYLPAFADGNGDGWGDLKGIISKLDYLDSLGVDGLILSAFYLSSGQDIDYSPIDHCQINSRYGNLKDFDNLVGELKKRRIKLITDLIFNHTSNQHPWFQAAQKSKHNSYRDWYHFLDPKSDGSTPNNWIAVFGGPMWTWQEKTHQYYLHTFFPEQPDLNWRQPQLQVEFKKIIRFWRNRGVDGFRIDAFPHLFKDPKWRDDPYQFNNKIDDPTYRPQEIMSSGHNHLGESFNEFIQVYGKDLKNVPLILESYFTPKQMRNFYRLTVSDLQGPMNLSLLKPNEPDYLAAYWPKPSGNHPYYVLGNHDQPRIVSRVGKRQAKALSLIALTLPGQPMIYQGEELGLPIATQIPPNRIRDIVGGRIPNGSRDGVRTPIPWDYETIQLSQKTTSWLPVPKNHAQLSVDKQLSNSKSWLNFYKQVIRVRKALKLGLNQPDISRNHGIIVYKYFEAWVLVNWSATSQTIRVSTKAELILSTRQRKNVKLDASKLTLYPYEGLVLAL